MTVLVMHTLPPDQTAADRWQWEFDLHDTARDLVAVVPDAAVAGVRGDPAELLEVIGRVRPDVIFNLCEAPFGNPRLEAHAAALFEWLRLSFTGSASETLALCRRKALTKHVLRGAGVPVPSAGGFPCIVKPEDEDGSAGIFSDSICVTPEEVARAQARIDGPVLVEDFLPGREFVVSLWGRTTPEALVIGEVDFRDGVRLLSYEGKWNLESHGYVNAPLVFDRPRPPELSAVIETTAQAAWCATGLRGYGTVDIRLDAASVPRVIDVNANPALNAEGRIYSSLEHAGWSWQRFVNQQIEWARTWTERCPVSLRQHL